jgi:hypothetical protein
MELCSHEQVYLKRECHTYAYTKVMLPLNRELSVPPVNF